MYKPPVILVAIFNPQPSEVSHDYEETTFAPALPVDISSLCGFTPSGF
jgi:hypothetical protein